MEKIVIFDWGGVIMHKHPVDNNDKQAIIRTIKSFNNSLSDDEAWDIYVKTLVDENGIFISRQNDDKSKIKWIDRLNYVGNLNTTEEELVKKFIQEHLKVGYYKDLVGEDYKTVEAHFKAAGFTNIELIDLNDAGIAFWNEGKVETISVGGDTSFDSYDYFDPNTKVVISYH